MVLPESSEYDFELYLVTCHFFQLGKIVVKPEKRRHDGVVLLQMFVQLVLLADLLLYSKLVNKFIEKWVELSGKNGVVSSTAKVSMDILAVGLPDELFEKLPSLPPVLSVL